MNAVMHPVAPVCAVIPPHILERLLESEDPVVTARARRTLEHDAVHRTRRQIATVCGPTAMPASEVSGTPRCTVYDAAHQRRAPGVEIHIGTAGVLADDTAVRAHAGLTATFDLYSKVYGRRSIDGAGLPLNATVRYGEKYNNAFWDGEQMVFGDGDGGHFRDFTIPLDIVGHELAHGVTQYTANLKYFGQPGALNESVSDVFGSLVKQYALGQTADQADWLIGSGLFTPAVAGKGLRSLAAPGTAYDDPQLGKDPQPAVMDDYVQTSRDNGGVHINSGIPNHAFYHLATTLGGHAWERAGMIWYTTLTSSALAPGAGFTDFAQLTAATARTLYGDGEEVQAVLDAWQNVRITIA
ncbi:M4 family metallopeptidase [Streptomyces sp. FIT100]|uniref:M4 family metallopeptidase n=1 Tax=Streptomyces sp. FIT100 TaxID=2837956 RepID=UPI0021CAC2AE|nr:M4 family metallopeptidase [Streptomyces sp. FIT100]UUN30928.1 M4 family metallopeptidase [Streptomyces sp. FIT100]